MGERWVVFDFDSVHLTGTKLNWFHSRVQTQPTIIELLCRYFHSSFGETPSVPSASTVSINSPRSTHSHHVTCGPPPQGIMRSTRSPGPYILT